MAELAWDHGMSESFLLAGTVARRKNMSKTMTFLHVTLDRPISGVAAGVVVQVVCSSAVGGEPAPRLARAGAQVEVQGCFEPGNGSERPGRVSILASSVTLVVPPPVGSSSAPPRAEPGSLCAAWLKDRGCADGAACLFRHTVADEDEAARIAAQALRAARAREADDFTQSSRLCAAYGDGCAEDGKVEKSARNVLFATWIAETYGAENLRKGSGVVDVAGGKGLVSVELAGSHRVPCTVLDPRCARPSKWELRQSRRRWAMNEQADFDASGSKFEGKSTSGQNQVFDVVTHEGLPRSSVCKDRGLPPLIRYVDLPLPDGSELDSGVTDADATVTESLLAEASLLIGMHSDEATEAIVDAGLRRGIHFAVVPCCAFQSRFPDRKFESGELVASTAQFINYLKAKAPEGKVKQVWLPFKGRNAVLYTV